MNRVISCLWLSLCLASCQTASELQKASTSGSIAAAVSCDQIYSAFNAYKSDKSTIQSLMVLTGATGVNLQNASQQTIDSYYQTARNNANIALAVQGCHPL
ncbi:hypothetical protein [Oceanicoccus sp. KOV_DT_Chl]|uniref:hypothetical protein n=1 Tax=Oceanicoccus sp. KOV_DT_Chl TaxID=1904639 RepID=UPI0011AF0156|nr:hypothetical protein [Oceanicoccus sp. KOV_DT_Chl]